jgi:hypothetical protein
VIMIPPGSGPGITHLASTPAMSPITINATMPMRFHLPCRHYSIPPDDTRQRNITDAVPEATIARFTPLSAGINTHVPSRIRALRSLQVSEKMKDLPDLRKGTLRLCAEPCHGWQRLESERPETYKPSSGLFLFQASQAIERSQRPIMAE